ALGSTDDRLAIGVFYQDDRPGYQEGLPQLAAGPLVDQPIGGADLSTLMAGLT
ncbi:MAG: hypothetical protein JRI68_30155, partial [Deltaproteobacteria bacterium]|nr:hypothetical protein [Deltaproteobacteria bacterium]